MTGIFKPSIIIPAFDKMPGVRPRQGDQAARRRHTAHPGPPAAVLPHPHRHRGTAAGLQGGIPVPLHHHRQRDDHSQQ